MRPANNRLRAAFFLALGTAACSAQIDPTYTGEPLATLRGSVTADQPQDAEVGVLWSSSSPEQCGTDLGFFCSAPLAGGFDDEGPSPDPECQMACDDQYPECDAAGTALWSACNAECGWASRPRTATLGICATGGVTDLVPVTGEFPASFQLDLSALPPESAILRDATGLGAAIGWFVALAPGADVTVDLFSDEAPAGITGGAEKYLLIYAADDIPEDSAWGEYLHGAYTKGYHVARMDIETQECPDDDFGCDAEDEVIVPAEDDLETNIVLVLAPFDEIEWPAFI